MSERLYYKTASELSTMLEKKSISAIDLTKDVLNRIHEVDDRVKAVTHLDEVDALAQATASDERRASGASLGALDGIPVGIKDILAVKGQPLTCGSKML
ncbi:MAG: Asp-tRNA(Asn)/Glu-tRNA(Gln) amidotransferase subunit GatA, partial [Opitutaceae bacterium]|nr:Asp-tRNA(Asn)/Glu-tRNA(Gln) amidotransferase subunit GatA [Opitutaceae bacterium]